MAWNLTLSLSRSRNDTVSGTTSTPAFAEKYRSSTWFIVVSVMIANFTDLFIYSAIVPVAPFALPIRAGIATDDVQYWISILLAIFNVFSIAASLPCGWISDKLGVRRPMFVIGTIIQFAGLALVTIGTSVALWVIGRALQGVACAVVLTTTLPLLLESAPKQQSGRYLGLFGMSASAGLVTGPLLGGAIYDRCGYYPVFALCFALNFLDSGMRLAIVEKKNSATGIVEEIDTEKATTIQVHKDVPTQVQVRVQAVLTDSDSDTASSLDIKKANLLSSLRHRSVIIELLCSKRMLAALYGGVLYTTVQTAFDATLTLFVEETFGWNSLGGGLIFVPLLMSDFCGPVFGWLGDKFGAKLTCTLGFLFAITPLVCLRFVENNTIEHKVLLCSLLATVGMGMAAVLPAVMAEIGAVIEEKGLTAASAGDKGGISAVSRAYGLFNIAYSGGCLIGPLWGGLVRESAGWSTMGWSLALFWASGIVPALLWLQ